MKKIALMLLLVCGFSYAADYKPEQGSMLALSCTSCHGTDGKSEAITPYIAGMSKTAMYQILLDYKYDKRDGSIMPKHAKGFSDDELEQVAYYFSKIER